MPGVAQPEPQTTGPVQVTQTREPGWHRGALGWRSLTLPWNKQSNCGGSLVIRPPWLCLLPGSSRHGSLGAEVLRVHQATPRSAGLGSSVWCMPSSGSSSSARPGHYSPRLAGRETLTQSLHQTQRSSSTCSWPGAEPTSIHSPPADRECGQTKQKPWSEVLPASHRDRTHNATRTPALSFRASVSIHLLPYPAPSVTP